MPSLKNTLPLLLLLSATSLAQSLSSLLGNDESLRGLFGVLKTQPDIVSSLSTAKNVTVLAPSNDAFSSFMKTPMAMMANNSTIKALLGYHVLEGVYMSSDFMEMPQFLPTMLMDKRFANFTMGGKQVVEAALEDEKYNLYSGLHMKSSVSKADVVFDGGVIHVIDSVLTLPMNVSTTAIAANLTAAAGALMRAGLDKAVDTMQSVTIFVPNNVAFQAIGNLLPSLDKDTLISILSYHVVPMVGFSTDLSDGQELTTLGGGKLTIRIKGGMYYVNGAKVTMANVITNNGVVHVIDNVLNPNNTNDTPNTADESQSAAFPSATRVNDVPFTSGLMTMTGSMTSMPTSTSTAAPGNTNAANTLRGNIAAGAVVGAAALFALAIVA